MKKILTSVSTLALLLILGCSNQEKKWEETKKANTIVGYEEYLKNYPDNPNRDLAKQAIETLSWTDALKKGTLQNFYDFKQKFPKNTHEKELQDNLDRLVTDPIIEALNVSLLKGWLIKNPESTLKLKLDSLLKRELIPFEYSMNFELEQTNTIHPKGKIRSLELNGFKIEIIDPILQDGLLRTKDFGNIEVVWKRTQYLDEQKLQLFATKMQIRKLNLKIKNQ